jgi:hypothetical protein
MSLGRMQFQPRTIVRPLLQGLVTTVVVTWALAVWPRDPGWQSPQRTIISSTPTDWIGTVPSGWTETAMWTWTNRSIGVTAVDLISVPPDVAATLPPLDDAPVGVNYNSQKLYAWGLPMRALYWVQTGGANGGPPTVSPCVVIPRVGVLPVVPSAGFVVNWIFWSCACALWPLSRALRRWLRSRRGLCPVCSYPVRELGGRCPECGPRLAASA